MAESENKRQIAKGEEKDKKIDQRGEGYVSDQIGQGKRKIVDWTDFPQNTDKFNAKYRGEKRRYLNPSQTNDISDVISVDHHLGFLSPAATSAPVASGSGEINELETWETEKEESEEEFLFDLIP